MFKGRFIFKPYSTFPWPIIMPNTIPDEGEKAFLEMVFQGSVADVALGGDFWLGLCGEVGVKPDASLVDITDEPAAVNGYGRQAIKRDASDFTIDFVNGVGRALSKILNFTATGDYTVPITRAFLCNVQTGTTGKLFAFSGPLPVPIIVSPSNPLAMSYECYYDGN